MRDRPSVSSTTGRAAAGPPARIGVVAAFVAALLASLLVVAAPRADAAPGAGSASRADAVTARGAASTTAAAGVPADVAAAGVPADVAAARVSDPAPDPCRALPARARGAGGGQSQVAPGQLVQQDKCVKLNEVQVLGSHNSYKLVPPEPIASALRTFDRELFESIEYGHPPLEVQFAEQGIRQIELDVFADPHGGRYYQRKGYLAVGMNPDSGLAELLEPGYKVMHVQDIDFATTCLTLVVCLQQVRAWSDANPGHLPIAILIEGKSDPIPDPLGLGFTVPLPFTTELLDDLDAEILSVFARERLITPDDVRGDHDSLEAAVLAGDWPTLAEARGKVYALFNNGGADRQAYLAGRPNLEGRVMFTTANPGLDDAAFVQIGDPRGANLARIQDLVAQGYLVRTRSDVPTIEARSGDTTRRDAALESGAQFVSTDYAWESPFGSGYQVGIPDGSPARCNPVNAPAGCRSSLLERLR
jgi:hypothetical protein